MIPLVSVILPCFNRAHLLSRALDSMLGQTYKNWELIIVDDASTDHTFKVVESYLEKSPSIRYYKLEKNGGACIARNVGLEHAKGEYISFLDSDDEYLPAKLEQQVNCFLNSTVPNLGVVSCGRQDVRNGKVYSTWIPKYRGNVLRKLVQRDRIGAGTPFLMVKKEVIRKFNIAFDPQMPASQDWDFLIQICRYTAFDFVPKVLVRVHHHSEERVYTNERALVAFEKQYDKIKGLLISDSSLHERFLIRMAVQNYVYGHSQKAQSILKEYILKKNFKATLWQYGIRAFPNFGSLPSRIVVKALRSID